LKIAKVVFENLTIPMLNPHLQLLPAAYFNPLRNVCKPGVGVHTCSPSTWETLSKKKKKKKKSKRKLLAQTIYTITGLKF
jgi:hypothetical protein